MLPSNTALIIIDFQKAIDHPSWGQRNNSQAEANAVNLLQAWRKSSYPVIHIRHNSRDPSSPYRPRQTGNDFKKEFLPLSNETVISKQTNSAFIGTDLESWLRTNNFTTLVIVGVATNNSVEATVRMGGNLGFEVYLVSDATFTFDRVDWSGHYRSAQEVHDMSLANLNKEYCTVADTMTILKLLGL